MPQQRSRAAEMAGQPETGSAPGPIRNILVVVDPTSIEHPCVDKAARIAKAAGAALELFVCDTGRDPPDTSSAGDDHGKLHESRRAQLVAVLESLAEPLRAQGLKVTTGYRAQMPLEHGVAMHALESKPDLVVKDSHHRHQPTRGVLTRTDWVLIRLLEKPLLLVRRDAWRDRMKITLCVDPCQPAERPVALDEFMLTFGEAFTTTMRGDLDAVHVLIPPPHLPGTRVADEEKRRFHGERRRVVQQLLDRNGRGSAPPVEFVEGGVAASILGFAGRHEPDIMVLGSSARPRFAHSAASGTAAQILEVLDADLLVVKPPGFVSPLLVTEE